MELDLKEMLHLPPTVPDGHSLNPVSALQLANSFGGVSAKLFLVGCEPAVLESENGEVGLSAPVRAALPQAIRLIDELVSELLARKQTDGCLASR